MLAVIVLIAFGIALSQGVPLGYTLVRDAGVDKYLPLNYSAAVESGWISYADCDPNLGIAMGYNGPPSKHYPITLYYTSTGFLAGIGADAFGDQADNLVQDGYWKVVSSSNSQYRASVSFRDAMYMCNNQNSSYILGDRLILNADTIAMELPTTDNDATDQKWTKGSCIQGMGTHWSYDIATAPQMSWKDYNLLPVVTMYVNGAISAIFFNSPVRQQSLIPPNNNMWDIIPIPSILMCENWCDSECGWSTYFWSTMHIFFYDPSTLHCDCSSKVCCD